MVQLYCSEQIAIPETFPNILKTFAKAAIRTQPYDILVWSAAYFRCLANDAPPPAKIRLEVDCRQGSLTKGYLKVLVAQVGKGFFIGRCLLQERWKALCLPEEELLKYLSLTRMLNWPQVHWLKLLAVMVGTLNKTPQDTMVMLCELLSDDMDGGLARIPYWMFKICYTFVAELECSKEQTFINGQLVLSGGRLEKAISMEKLPRILSSTLINDTIIASCKAQLDVPNYEECTCSLESFSDTASSIFMINATLGDPKDLFAKCEDFDTIMLLLKDAQGKPLPVPEFKGPHYISEKQQKKAQQIEQVCLEQHQQDFEKCEKNAEVHLRDEAFQMLNEVGPPWTWLHQFNVSDFNTASYNFVDEEFSASDLTPEVTSDDSYNIIIDETKPDKDKVSSSSCYASEAEGKEKKKSMDSLKLLIEDAAKLYKCDIEKTSSIITLLKSEELGVLQRAGEGAIDVIDINKVVEVLQKAEDKCLVFQSVDCLVDYVQETLYGNLDDFPHRSKSKHREKEETIPSVDDVFMPCIELEPVVVPEDWQHTIPIQVEVPPRGPREKLPEKPKKIKQKDDMVAIFESSVGIPPEQVSKMPKFCYEPKDADELILGLVTLSEEEEEAEEEDLGSALPESDSWSNKGYRSDDEDIFEIEDEPRPPRVPPDDMDHYCCLNAPTLTTKPYVPPAPQFSCTIQVFPGIGAAVSKKTIDDFLAFVRLRSRDQKGLIHPRNFKEEKCPYMIDKAL